MIIAYDFANCNTFFRFFGRFFFTTEGIASPDFRGVTGEIQIFLAIGRPTWYNTT